MSDALEKLLLDDKFLDLVKEEALKQGKVFFINSGEGRDEIINGMYVEDLSGWLIDVKDEERFKRQWSEGWDNIDDAFDKNFVFAIWERDNNKIKVKFIKA